MKISTHNLLQFVSQIFLLLIAWEHNTDNWHTKTVDRQLLNDSRKCWKKTFYVLCNVAVNLRNTLNISLQNTFYHVLVLRINLG